MNHYRTQRATAEMKYEFDDGRIVKFELDISIQPEEKATWDYPGSPETMDWEFVTKLDPEDEKEISEWLREHEGAIWRAINEREY